MDLTRRSFLRIGAASAFAPALPFDLLPAPGARADSVILVWLDGGPSHLELWDPKPGAPPEMRGPFQPIDTPVRGLRIAESLPRIAASMDKATLIRSMTSTEGNHDRGAHYLQTGWHPSPSVEHPSMGSVAWRERGAAGVLPGAVAIPRPPSYGGAGFFPARYAPFPVGADPGKPGFQVRDLEPAGDAARAARRRALLAELDRSSGLGPAPDREADFDAAYAFSGSAEARAAFDLSLEPEARRARYGGSRLGQGCLLARRLVGSGVRFVTVNDEGWDHHENIGRVMTEAYAGGRGTGKAFQLDQAVSALLEDLDATGRLERTLVVVAGEFGRTPKLNERGGRDHWPRAFSVLLAGGGVKRGHVHGATDGTGELPAEDPVEPEDLVATVYALLGIDAAKEHRSPEGRPIRLLNRGRVVEEVLA